MVANRHRLRHLAKRGNKRAATLATENIARHS